MKNILISTVSFLTIALLSSCMDTIDVEVKNNESLVTVDAFINDLRQDQVIKLTRTDNYFSGNVPPAIHGAGVIIKDITANRTFVFSDNGDGNYVYRLDDSDTLVFAGHDYELTIEIGAYRYRSSTTGKRSAHIDALYYDSTGTGSDGIGTKGLKLLARDAKGPVADFYWIKSYLNGKFLNKTEQIKLEYFGYNNELDGAYFNPMIWSMFGQDGDDKNLKKGDQIRVEILGISQGTFDFLSLGKQMSNNGGLFATTSVNLPSNIVPVGENTARATGMFSVSKIAVKELIIQ